MTKDEALDLAMEALEHMLEDAKQERLTVEYWNECVDAITAIKQARSAPVQEPVAWQGVHDKTDLYYRKPVQGDVRPLYTTPPAAPVQGYVTGLDVYLDPADMKPKRYPAAQPAPVQDDMPKIGCVNHDCDKCKAAAPVQELEKAAAMALDAIAASGDFLFNWHDCEPNNEREMDGYSEVLALNEKAFNALRKCLLTPAAQRQWVGLTDEDREHIVNNSMTPACVAIATETKLKEKNNG
jgi:hypothetical protein